LHQILILIEFVVEVKAGIQQSTKTDLSTTFEITVVEGWLVSSVEEQKGLQINNLLHLRFLRCYQGCWI
jgi:hypothetical protein